MKYDVIGHGTYLSLGAGVQSTALLIMSNLNLYDCPRADYAIFADTQSEPKYVYDHLRILERWSKIPIVSCTAGSLEQSLLHNNRDFASIPSFTPPSGMLRRQCTREYKITPIMQKVRELNGLKARQRMRRTAHMLIGISTDEIGRAKTSRTPWMVNVYPLITARLRREDCLRIITDAGLPLPLKSACVFCPYHNNQTWKNLKENHPDEWKRVVAVDEHIRSLHKTKVGGINSECFLHKSLKPIADVDFSEQNHDLFESECEGYCGI